MLINLTAVLTERDPDKNLPINLRRKKNQQSSFVFLASTPSQMNITIKYRDRLKYESQEAARLLQTCPEFTNSGSRCYLYALSLLLLGIACYSFCKQEEDEAGQHGKCLTIPIGNFLQGPIVNPYQWKDDGSILAVWVLVFSWFVRARCSADDGYSLTCTSSVRTR